MAVININVTLDPTLVALGALDATAGLVEQTGVDTFTKRAIGVGAGTSIPTRADADARYDATGAASTAQANAIAAAAADATTKANAAQAFSIQRANHTGTQLSSTISDFDAAARAQTEAELLAGTNITITPSGAGATRQLTIAATAAGTGDVVGPASATDNAIARYNLTTGKLLQDSGITIADGATGTLSGTNTGDQDLSGLQPLNGGLTEIAAITGTQGDLLYHNGSDWADLAAGTNGQRLRTNGAGANPTWEYSVSTIPVLVANAAASTAWTDMPAALTYFLGQVRWTYMADLTHATQIRINVIVGGVAAVNNAKIRLLYRTQAAGVSITIGDYVTVGSSEVQATLSASTNTLFTSGWIDLVAGAKAAVLLALAGIDGNGAADPTFSTITVEVR